MIGRWHRGLELRRQSKRGIEGGVRECPDFGDGLSVEAKHPDAPGVEHVAFGITLVHGQRGLTVSTSRHKAESRPLVRWTYACQKRGHYVAAGVAQRSRRH